MCSEKLLFLERFEEIGITTSQLTSIKKEPFGSFFLKAI